MVKELITIHFHMYQAEHFGLKDNKQDNINLMSYLMQVELPNCQISMVVNVVDIR